MKLNKKFLSLISVGLMALALLLWLVLPAVKYTSTMGKLESSETYSGIQALFGIKVEGTEEKFTGFNVIAFITVVVALASAAFAYLRPGHIFAVVGLVLASILFIVIGFTMGAAFTKDVKEIMEHMKDYYSWAPAVGSILATVFGLGSAGVSFYASKVKK